MLKIEYVDIESLTPYEGNAKEHPPEQVEQIIRSIEEFGMNDPIAVYGKDNLIVEGHGRWLACSIMDMKEVPVIRLDHLTEEQRRAYTLIHNKLTMNSDFNLDKLEVELGQIEEIDMSDFGFEIDDPEERVPGEDDNFDAPLPAEPNCKRGQIYMLGDHRLMVGDSTNEDDVRALMDGEEADLCVTDPPYNVNIENSDGMTIENDNMAGFAFEEFLRSAFSNMEEVLAKGAPFYIYYASRTAAAFLQALMDNNLEVREQLIWVKNTFVLGRSDYHWQHEPILYGWKEGPHYFTESRKESTTIEIPESPDFDHMKKDEAIKLLKEIYQYTATTIMREKKPTADDMHPTMKPIPLLVYQIQNSSRKGDIVLDLFGGSGSTLIACEQTGRKCRMMEYDPRYADVIIDRYEKFTGDDAKLIKDVE